MAWSRLSRLVFGLSCSLVWFAVQSALCAQTSTVQNPRLHASNRPHQTKRPAADQENRDGRKPAAKSSVAPTDGSVDRTEVKDSGSNRLASDRKSVPASNASYSRGPTDSSSGAIQEPDSSGETDDRVAGQTTDANTIEQAANDADDASEPETWRLFSGPMLDRHQIEVGGWWSNGYTWNPSRPTNRLNGLNGVNDRANDYMFHQLGLGIERAVDPSLADYQWGCRVDLMYGADARLVQSAGFDDTWHSGRFVSLAVPQVYAEWFDPNLNPWGQGVTLRVGRFWSPIGYEGVPSLDRFFFSATHAFMLAQPSTHVGVMATADVGPNWTTQVGLVRGWDVTTDNNKSPGYLGTLNWLSDDEATSVTHVLYHGDETDNLSDAQTTYELILTRQLTEQWSYVGWFDFNFAQRVATNSVGDPSNGQWFSLNQALLHAITDRTSWGVRGEWLHDNDGVVIINPETGDPLGQGNLFGVTFGINHTPTMNLLLRPELRWDWSSGGLPFDDQTSSRQFTAGFDVVLSF
ncbi:MAG: outer membrane beta-barrel protein [Planctomycetaceae bacterium]|nr:outer membrane beta-barrel protein [Planctomycetaceae bacterium]